MEATRVKREEDRIKRLEDAEVSTCETNIFTHLNLSNIGDCLRKPTNESSLSRVFSRAVF